MTPERFQEFKKFLEKRPDLWEGATWNDTNTLKHKSWIITYHPSTGTVYPNGKNKEMAMDLIKKFTEANPLPITQRGAIAIREEIIIKTKEAGKIINKTTIPLFESEWDLLDDKIQEKLFEAAGLDYKKSNIHIRSSNGEFIEKSVALRETNEGIKKRHKAGFSLVMDGTKIKIVDNDPGEQ